MATPCPSDELLSLHVDGELDPTERSVVATHLAQCQLCRRLVGTLALARTHASTRNSQIFPPATWRWKARTTVDRLVILGPLGRGGMGEVYEARDLELNRIVAVKVTRLDGAAENERLLAEGRALAAFNHPNVNRVFDVGVHDGATYIVLERAPGQTLQHWLTRTPRSVRTVLGQFADLADGCATLHEAGLVHRDIKPTNILISAEGQAVLGDFGLVSTVQPGRAGTPGYIAPEVEAGGPATAASDQYALCKTLSETLARCQGRVPRRVQAACARGMHRDPQQRFESLRALRRALAPRAPRIALLAVALPLIALVPTGDNTDDCGWRHAPWSDTQSAPSSWQDYRDAWEEAATTACSLHADSAVRECLLSQRADAEALLETGLSADPIVSNVWLTFEPEVCMSVDPDASHTSERVRELVEQSHAAKLGGDMPGAATAASEAAELARRLGTPRDALLALRNQAYLARALGKFETSRDRFEAAYWIAFQLDESVQAADAALGVMNVFNLALDADGARLWLRNAEAALKRSPEPEHARWHGLEAGAAFMHQNAGALQASVEAAKRALEHANQIPDTLSVGDSEILVGETLSAAGDWREAKRYYDAGLESTRARFGEESIPFGNALGTYAAFCISALHDHACATDFYRRSIDSAEQHQLRGLFVPLSYAQLAASLLEQGRVDEARPVVEKANTLFAEYFPAEHPQQIWVRNLAASFASAEGLHDEARRAAEEAVQFATSSFGANDPNTAAVLTTQAEVLLRAGDAQAAKTRLDEALSVAEQSLDPDHLDVSVIRLTRAEAFEALGDRSGAAAIYRRLAGLDLPKSLARSAAEGLARTTATQAPPVQAAADDR